METFDVSLTQYMRPDGHQITIGGKLPIDLRDKFEALRSANLTFGAEVLMNGTVSFSIEDLGLGIDAAITLGPNGPECVAKFEAMVRNFDLPAYIADRAADEVEG